MLTTLSSRPTIGFQRLMRRLFHRLTASLCLVAMIGGTLSAAAPGRWGVKRFEGTGDQWFELDYYEGSALVRREVDLNFDERIDFVESFDRVTHERIRLVVDDNFDGHPDRLVLYEDGREVAVEALVPEDRSGKRFRAEPLPLPAGLDLALVSVDSAARAENTINFVETSALPVHWSTQPTAVTPSVLVPARDQLLATVSLSPRPPRGPPAVHTSGVASTN